MKTDTEIYGACKDVILEENDICIECIRARGRRKRDDPNLCNHAVFKVCV